MVATMGFESRAQVVSYDRDPVYDGIMQTSQYIDSFDDTRLAITIIRPTLIGQVAIAPACASPQFYDHGVAMNGINIFPVGAKPYSGKASVPSTAGMGGPVMRPALEDVAITHAYAITKSGIAILQFMGWWDGSSITGKNISTRSLQWLLQNAIQRGRTQLPVHNN